MYIASELFRDTGSSITLFFIIITIIQLFYHWYYFARVAFPARKQTVVSENTPPVSVIICARNEYENLRKFLPKVLEQKYPDFEVILVNDFSQDESYFLIKSFEEKYSNFKVINLRENVNFFEGKKLALAVGIKSAKNDIVLLTDADCEPIGNEWIKTMVSGFTPGTEIVLGYGGYRHSAGLLNWFIRFDTLTIALQYMGMAMAGSPYMGVGRNLAYRKQLFFKTGGFASHYKIKSGDDDLFVNQAAKKGNTHVCLSAEGITLSEPKRSFQDWFKQKKRHLSTGVYYKWFDKFRLGLFGVSSVLFYTTFVVSLFFPQTYLSLAIIIGLFAARLASQLTIYYNAGKRFHEKKLFLFSPILEMIFLALNPVFAISNLFYRKNKWK